MKVNVSFGHGKPFSMGNMRVDETNAAAFNQFISGAMGTATVISSGSFLSSDSKAPGIVWPVDSSQSTRINIFPRQERPWDVANPELSGWR